MTELQPSCDPVHARETLKHISLQGSIFRRVAHVLELVAHNSVGLGEVLQDYAHQSGGQLTQVIRAAENGLQGIDLAEDKVILHNVHPILAAVKSVLEMTPAAMQRNKADTIGEKEKFSRADIAELTHVFLHSPDVIRLLASEDSGQMFTSSSSGKSEGPDHFRIASH